MTLCSMKGANPDLAEGLAQWVSSSIVLILSSIVTHWVRSISIGLPTPLTDLRACDNSDPRWGQVDGWSLCNRLRDLQVLLFSRRLHWAGGVF